MKSEREPKKKVYSTPQLTIYGNVEVITQGNSSGNYLDQGFPAGAAFDDLTFSN